MFLNSICADAQVWGLFHAYSEPGTQLARVGFESRERYRLFLEQGECDATLAGHMRLQDDWPTVGDWVIARVVDRDSAVIEGLLPRRTCFSRRAAGRAAGQQTLAANVDLAVVVCGLDGDFNLRRVERYIVLTRESGADTLIVLNKSDLTPDAATRSEQVRRLSPAIDVLAITARDSVESLRPRLLGRTSVLLGSSGVGKSTIVNALLDTTRQSTSEVRASDSRGRHTTTSRCLIPLPGGGAIIDGPGMRELQLLADADSVTGAFEDISALAERCRFRDCTHSGEPDCAVAEALLTGELTPERWQSFQKLSKEVRHTRVEQDVRLRLEEKRKLKVLYRSLRARK